MQIYILSNREVVKNEVAGNNGENNAEIMQFHFPDKIVDIDMSNITKWIQFHNDNFDLLQMIENDKYSLTDLITQYENVEYQVLLKYNNLVLWKSNVAELNFGESLDVNVTITIDDLSVLNQLRLQVIELKKQYEELLKQGNDDIADLIKQIEDLETKINEAEALRETAEQNRVTAENERVKAEAKRNKTLADLVKEVNDTISRLSHSVDEYNKNAETQLSRLESTADTGVSAVNSAKNSAISSISKAEETAVDNIEAKETSSIKSIDDETTKKIKEIDDNTADKITEFDTNAENKTNTFNTNSTTKTTAFNNNATTKTNSFNENATSKLNEFNNNYEAKKEEINSEVSIDRISTLEQEVFEKDHIISENNYLTLDDTEEELNIAVNEIESNKLEQETREGYNMINVENAEYPSHDVNIIKYKNGLIIEYDLTGRFILFKLNKNLEPNKEYTLKLNSENLGNNSVSVKAILNQNSQYININDSFIPNSEANQLQIYIDDNVYVEGTKVAITDILLYEGTEDKLYEKYGQSPSTKFPSPVEGVTGDVKLKVQNKNYASNIIYLNQTQNYLPAVICDVQYQKGQYYIVSFDIPNTGDTVYINQGTNWGIRRVTAEYSMVCDGTRKYYVVQALETITKENINFVNKTNEHLDVSTGLLSNFMIEKIKALTDEEALKFVPTDFIEHKEQEVTLSLEEKTLYKGDKIIRKEGKWYFYNEFLKYIFDGNENIIIGLNKENKLIYVPVNNIVNTWIKNDSVYSNYYKNLNGYNVWNSIDGITSDERNIIIYDSKLQNVNDFKEKMKELYENNKPLYVVYQLNKPELEEITDTTLINQLNQLLRLKQYNSITNIDFDNDVIFEIDIDKSEIKLLKEINEEQNVKIEQLKQENEYQEKVIDGLLNGYETETVTSDNVTINDCLNAPVNIQARGRIYQETSSIGKNIIPTAKKYWEPGHYTSTGIKGPYATRMRLIDLIECESNIEYYVSKSVFILRGYNANKEMVQDIGAVNGINNQTFTTAEDVVYLGISVDKLYDEYDEETDQLMICKMSEADKTWEKGYVDMPSLKYKSEVEYTKGSQEIEHINENIVDDLSMLLTRQIDNGRITVNVSDGKIIVNGTPSVNYVNISETIDIIDLLEDSETYTLINFGDLKKIYNQVQAIRYDDSKTYYHTSLTHTQKFVVDKSKNKSYLYNFQTYLVNDVGTLNNYTCNFMLVKGDKDLNEYISHKSEKYLLSNLPPMYSENNDYIYYNEEQKKYFVHNEWDKYTFTGDEDYSSIDNIYTMLKDISLKHYDESEIPNFKSNMFIPIENNIIYNSNIKNALSSYIPTTSYNYQKIVIKNTEISTVTELKSWLKNFYNEGNALYIVYPLIKAKDTEITDSILIKQLDKLRKVFSYKGTNYFIVTSDSGQPAKLKVIAYKDSFKILNDKIDRMLENINNNSQTIQEDEFIL